MCTGQNTEDNVPEDRIAHREILLFISSLENTPPESPSFLHYIFPGARLSRLLLQS